MKDTTVAVIGTGYVGLTTAVLMAAAGIKTYVVDINSDRLDSIRHGKSFFYEDGVDPLVVGGVKSGNIIPTSSYKEAIPYCDIVISAVGTPDNPDGSSNLSYVFDAAREAAKYLKPGAIFVQKSTVVVGTGRKIEEIFKESKAKITYLSNPEFLREGAAIQDSLWFDRLVVGGDDKVACQKLIGLYKHIESVREDIMDKAGLGLPEESFKEQYIVTHLESAEMIKVISNAFLAMKISFANSIAILADKINADVVEVMNIVGVDHRINRAFLDTGRGYGGGCFPKDVSGLIAAGLDKGVDLELMRATQAINEAMPGYVIEKLQDILGGSLVDKNVAVLGLAFKAGTSDVRRSPSIKMANILTKAKALVRVYDPKANDEAKESLLNSVSIESSIEAAITGADAVIIGVDWLEFLEYSLEDYKNKMHGDIFVDAMNRFDPKTVTKAGLRYIGVGR